ncbi:translation initiation factor IF-2-like [Panthera tigris]|uniref:translation initiation factor IF-2-like n=1 Tax=Panthera tigris TaxID=9694 RepID=UPI001C6F96FD|nr:translation initiation factor IF-2-like [Panthera tigris]XP_042828533.1 translation initiation factor IF-2-like [Panthera tigris]XP_042828534.1 translation initiation factor IF-2-like [Panthera tigris]XP_042828535.1 translation initiation factor IF-2-like [Panthera tigris]XP_042828536.1 translation initiation factor IF-2-like [Panthera tigris]XP_042828537.1 translation initiation factor IF-2-like [Panthera tigris]XP_042828538.1 translation initiation factor IF-2-like [Panthera tigris]XP_0
MHIKRQMLSLNTGPCAILDRSLTPQQPFTPRLQGPYDQPRRAVRKPRQHALGPGAKAKRRRRAAAQTARFIASGPRPRPARRGPHTRAASSCGLSRPLPARANKNPRLAGLFPAPTGGTAQGEANTDPRRSGRAPSGRRIGAGAPGRLPHTLPQSPSPRPPVGALRYVGAGRGGVNGSVLGPPTGPGPSTFEQAEQRRRRRRRQRQLQAEERGGAGHRDRRSPSCARAASRRVGRRALWRREAPSAARPALSWKLGTSLH